MPKVLALVGQEDRKLYRPPTLTEFIVAQAQDTTYKQYALTIVHTESKLNMDISELIVRQYIIESSIQTIVPIVFQTRLLYITHHPSLPGRTGQRRMCDPIRLEYYQSHIANDVYTRIYDCQQYAEQGATIKH